MIIRFSSRESNQIAYDEASRRMEGGEYLEAFKSFLSVAQRGHSPSMSMLGTLLTQHGLELEEYGGYKEGVSWYRKAATCGDVSAIKALSELNEKPVTVFNPIVKIVIPNILIYLLSFPFMVFATIVGVHMVHTFLIVISVAWYVTQFLASYYMFEPHDPRYFRHYYEVEREIAYTSVVVSIIFIIGMILFVTGFGLAAENASRGENGRFISMLVQIMVSAWIIFFNTILVIKIKRRNLNDTQYKTLMNLTAKLSKRWESILVALILLGNLVLVAMCFYRVISEI